MVWGNFSFVVWWLYKKSRPLRIRLRLEVYRAASLYLTFQQHSKRGAGIGHRSHSIVHLLQQNRLKDAADRRDHIFAFLGHYLMPSGLNSKAIVECNYLMPVEDVYRQFTVGMLKATKNLDVLNTIQHRKARIHGMHFKWRLFCSECH
jgi:hypothetical protein